MPEQWVIVRRPPNEGGGYHVYDSGYEPERIRGAVKNCVDRHVDDDVWAARASKVPYPRGGATPELSPAG